MTDKTPKNEGAVRQLSRAISVLVRQFAQETGIPLDDIAVKITLGKTYDGDDLTKRLDAVDHD